MTLWFEAAVVATVFALGNILFGHFEEKTPRWRRVMKFVLVMVVAVSLSAYLGRVWFWGFLVALLLPAVYIHAFWLPRRGINGWTGEPREKYYELRGWTKR